MVINGRPLIIFQPPTPFMTEIIISENDDYINTRDKQGVTKGNYSGLKLRI